MARSKQPKGKFVNDPRTQKIIELAAQMLGDDAYKGKSFFEIEQTVDEKKNERNSVTVKS